MRAVLVVGLSLTLATVLLSQGTASAQACTGGRVASDLTLYQCCWPGQVWSDAQHACSGPPICPTGMVRRGEDCSVHAEPAPPVPSRWSGDAVVEFVAPPARHEGFTVLDDAGHVAGACLSAPCSLNMRPGAYQLLLDSRWLHARRRLDVPASGVVVSDLRPPFNAETIALATGGSVATAGGFVLVFTGMIEAWALDFSVGLARAFGNVAVAPPDYGPATAFAVTGGLVAVSGISMLIAMAVVRRGERIQIVPRDHEHSSRVAFGVAPTEGGALASIAVQWRGF